LIGAFFLLASTCKPKNQALSEQASIHVNWGFSAMEKGKIIMQKKNVKRATRRGKKMTKTGPWWLEPKKGLARGFSGTLLASLNHGGRRLAIFSVPTRFK
jgi:hypothetical protein